MASTWYPASREACRAVVDKVFGMTDGEGRTEVTLRGTQSGSIRWALNRIVSGSDSRRTSLGLARTLDGVIGRSGTAGVSDAQLLACVQNAERSARFGVSNPDAYPDAQPAVHPHAAPVLWFDRTVALNETDRTAVAAAAIDAAVAAQGIHGGTLVSAGDVLVNGTVSAVATDRGLFRHYQSTEAIYSLTVRDPAAGGSGWAGVDWNDWTRIDVADLTHRAVEKCVRARNPVAIEPGRYTAILEPQAVCDLVAPLVEMALSRSGAEQGNGPFAAEMGETKIGQRVVDPRVTISADPMDPDCGFVPFDWRGEPYPAVTWIGQGVLRELAYDRDYGLRQLGADAALPNSRAFRMSGGTTSVEEMVVATKRGVLVTRFDGVGVVDFKSMSLTGTTRDGVWLVQDGKIVKPIKNFRIAESPLFVLNNIEAMGRPRRVFRPGTPAVVPPLLVRDFWFSGLIDAV